MCRPRMVNRSSTATTAASAIVSQTPAGTRAHVRSGGSAVSRSLSHVTGATTIVSLARPLAAPRRPPHIPKVTMNGESRRPVTSPPMITPHRPPSITTAPAAARGDQPWARSVASPTVARAICDPTDRSMPPLAITSVMPRAAVPTTAVCSSMISTLAAVGNCRGLSAEKRATTRRSPSRGPSFFTHSFIRPPSLRPRSHARCTR